jgi:hypothetical protein
MTLTTVTTVTAQVTDTNQRHKGAIPVQVEFDAEGPVRAQHAGQVYRYTGKAGHNLATGVAVREMATIDDARLWITLDGTQVWED